MPNVPFAGTWQGRAQVGEFFRKVAASQEQVEYTPDHFIAQGDKDVGNVAAWVASDQARTLTATEINISCGAIVD